MGKQTELKLLKVSFTLRACHLLDFRILDSIPERPECCVPLSTFKMRYVLWSQ